MKPILVVHGSEHNTQYFDDLEEKMGTLVDRLDENKLKNLSIADYFAIADFSAVIVEDSSLQTPITKEVSDLKLGDVRTYFNNHPNHPVVRFSPGSSVDKNPLFFYYSTQSPTSELTQVLLWRGYDWIYVNENEKDAELLSKTLGSVHKFRRSKQDHR